MTPAADLRLTSSQWMLLSKHLFPGDGDEHGAVILAGVAVTPSGMTLIAREVVLAVDGVEYVAGQQGYRMLTADFVRRLSDRAARERLAYIAVHCHGGATSVSLSADDRRSQSRGYPALLDILDGPPVAGAVFAQSAAAADIWLPDRTRIPLRRVLVSGTTRLVLRPSMPSPRPVSGSDHYHRQSLLFGARGQHLLSELTVAVVGCGGIGSILVELLSRLGVGHLIVIDPDRVEISNLPRIVGATRLDAMTWLTRDDRQSWIRARGARLARRKTAVAARVAKRANRDCRVTRLDADVCDPTVAAQLRDVDYIFLAADTFRARLVVNAICFQYCVPGVQLGSKVRVATDDGTITDVFSVARPFGPERGCLICNDLIPAARLTDETETDDQRRAQRYVQDEAVRVPSVITLNALAAAWASNEFMFAVTGLPRAHAADHYVTFRPATGEVEWTTPRRDADCLECGDGARSRRGRGDAVPLPTGL